MGNKAVLKTKCKWQRPGGGSIELSAGFHITDVISLMKQSLTDEETNLLIAELNEMLIERESRNKNGK